MKPNVCFYLLILCLSISCDDIFVTDISNKEIIINCPKDQFTTKSTTPIVFWWETLDGAETYDLQVVSSDFDNIIKLYLDVSIDSTRFNITLPAGDYQWRIRANNSSFSTQYIIRTISVVNEE